MQEAPAKPPKPSPAMLPETSNLPVSLGEHLGRRVLLGGFAVPSWILSATAVFTTAGVAGIAAALLALGLSSSTPATVASPAPPAPPAPPASARDVPVVELASAGDPGAMKKLESKPASERTVDETIALADGEAVRRKADLGVLANDLRRNPNLGKDPDNLARLRKATENEELARDALRILATLPGSKPADIMYEVWVGTPERTSTTELAEALLYTREVREKVSPALRVALDLRAKEECEDLLPVVERALEHGDQRSVRLLGKLTLRYGCGKHKSKDCYPCLRGKNILTDAINAARKRPAPKL